MPGGLKPRAPARNRTEETRRRGAAGHRQVARDELGPKMMDFAPADLSSPDPRLMLKKRLREEMEALRGILRKAELLAGKTAAAGLEAPRRGKDGCFLAAEARPAASKRRKTMALVEVKPRMSADEISNLATRVSSLSEDMPSHILEFLKECTGHEDKSRGEMEIDIGSMRSSAMFELRKLLDEFAEEEKRQRQIEESTNASRAISRSPPPQHEDGEIEEDNDAVTDTRGDVVVAGKVLCSPAPIEDGEIPEEDIICSDVAPGSTENLAETGNSPSSSSSSGSSSNSGCSSGSSSSSSSDSDSSDSDCDDESMTSNPAPAVLPKTDASPVVPHKVLCSSPCISSLLEGGASPAAPEKFAAETVNIPRNSYLSGSAPEKFAAETVNIPRNSYSSGSAVLPKPLEQRSGAQDHKLPDLSKAEYSDMIAKARQKLRRLHNPKRQRAYEKLEEMERNAKPISDWIHPMYLRQLGITLSQYAVTPERRVPGRGSPVQRLLGLFLKAE